MPIVLQENFAFNVKLHHRPSLWNHETANHTEDSVWATCHLFDVVSWSDIFRPGMYPYSFILLQAFPTVSCTRLCSLVARLINTTTRTHCYYKITRLSPRKITT